MNERIYRRPISVQTRSRIILAVVLTAIAVGILQGLPDTMESLSMIMGLN